MNRGRQTQSKHATCASIPRETQVHTHKGREVKAAFSVEQVRATLRVKYVRKAGERALMIPVGTFSHLTLFSIGAFRTVAFVNDARLASWRPPIENKDIKKKEQEDCFDQIKGCQDTLSTGQDCKASICVWTVWSRQSVLCKPHRRSSLSEPLSTIRARNVFLALLPNN